jgi:hypothetical protein
VRHPSGMVRRRQQFDPLATTKETRWLVVRDRCQQPIEYRELRPGTDLRAVLSNQKAAPARDGWTLEGNSSPNTRR